CSRVARFRATSRSHCGDPRPVDLRCPPAPPPSDMFQFAEAIKEFRTQCDREVARNPATREHVQQLEQQYDASAAEEPSTLPSGELDSDKLMQDLEDFLRKEREGGQQS